MANTVIQLKKSSTPGSSPSTGNLANGELAINFADGVIYYKNLVGQVAQFTAPGKNYGTVNANGTLLVSGIAGDVFTILPGQNITVVGDAVNDRVTIGADLTSANGWANTKLANTSGVSFAGNLFFPTGNVGIGTSSPSSKLQVNGTITIANTGPVESFRSGANTITLNMYDEANGTLSWEGSAGQLFSITNDLSGSLFTVNDVSGIPSIEVDALGNVDLAPFGGNVGIGTSNPVYKLDVQGDARITGNLTLGDARTDTVTINAANFNLANNVSFDSGTLFIDSQNNRVGIGTTIPTSTLHVKGTSTIEDVSSSVKLTSSIDSGGWTYLNSAGAGGAVWNFQWNGTTLAQLGNGGIQSPAGAGWLSVNRLVSAHTGGNSLHFVNEENTPISTGISGGSSSQSVQIWTSNTERMRITSGGNVGIGTSAPSSRLHISKAGTGDEFIIGDLATNYVKIGGIGSGTSYLRSFESSFDINNPFANGNLLFSTAGSERLRITSVGDIGVGTSSPETYKSGNAANSRALIVKGACNNNTEYGSITLVGYAGGGAVAGSVDFFAHGYNIVSAIRPIMVGGGNSADLGFYTASGGVLTKNMYLTSSGKLITNQITAYDNFYAAEGTPLILSNYSTGVGTNIKLKFQGSDGSGGTPESGYIKSIRTAITSSTVTCDLSFAVTNNSNTSYEVVRFKSDGNVGIGTSSPAYKLDVNGSVKLANTSFLYWGNYDGTTVGASIRSAGNDGLYLESGPNGPGRGAVSIKGYNNSQFETALGVLSLKASQVGSGYITLDTAGSERVRVDASGNVGIATTSVYNRFQIARYPLDILGAGYGNPTGIENAKASINEGGLYITSKVNDVANAGLTLAVIRNGNVSDGSSYIDWIYSPSGSGQSDTRTSRIKGGQINAYGSVVGWGYLGFETAGPGGASSTERMRIDANGNIGIGTTSPSAKLDVVAGTSTSNTTSLVNLTQTWNNSGNTFTAIQTNITDTASASTSKLIDLQVAGNTKFKVEKSGDIYIAHSRKIESFPDSYNNYTSIDFGAQGSASMAFYQNGTPATAFRWNDAVPGVRLISTNSLNWTSVGNASASADLAIWRDGSNILAQRFGASGQTFRLYGTYTDSANYERLSFSANSTAAYIQTQNGGTGIARPLYLGANNQTVITVATDKSVGVKQSLVGRSDIDHVTYSIFQATTDNVYLCNDQNRSGGVGYPPTSIFLGSVASDNFNRDIFRISNNVLWIGGKLNLVRPAGDPNNVGWASSGMMIISRSINTNNLGIGTSADDSYAWLQYWHDGITKSIAINPNGGNVGIGTTSPAAKLHVDTTSSVINDDTARFQYDNGSAAIRLIGSSSQNIYFGNSSFTQKGTIRYSNLTDFFAFWTASSEKVRIDVNGNVGIGTTSPSAKLDANTDIIRIRTSKTPASATATGNQGDICWDSNYIYVCTAANTWVRANLSTW